MDPTGSVSEWIASLKEGDEAAASRLWDRYFRRLVAHARARLGATAASLADEEDVALSAFHTLYRGAAADRFPQLRDRDNLWRVLLTLVAQKAVDLHRHERRIKRAGRTPGEAVSTDEILAADLPPDLLAQMTEECDQLLGRLRTDELRTVARWRLEGFTVEEIAGKLGCVSRTVERKLEVIRRLWALEGQP